MVEPLERAVGAVVALSEGSTTLGALPEAGSTGGFRNVVVHCDLNKYFYFLPLSITVSLLCM